MCRGFDSLQGRLYGQGIPVVWDSCPLIVRKAFWTSANSLRNLFSPLLNSRHRVPRRLALAQLRRQALGIHWRPPGLFLLMKHTTHCDPPLRAPTPNGFALCPLGSVYHLAYGTPSI